MNITRFTREVIRRTKIASIRRISTAHPAFLRIQPKVEFHNGSRVFSAFSKSPDYSEVPVMDQVTFESLCAETIESLTDYFEEIVDADPTLATADIAYSVNLMTFCNLHVNNNFA